MPKPSTQPSTESKPDAVRPKDFPHRVLLTVPDALTIPIFALGIEARRKPFEDKVVEDKGAFSRLVGGNLLRTLTSGRYGEHRLINTRWRLGERTAVYASWLAFPALAQAEAFLGDHPRFGLAAIKARTRTELAHMEATLRGDAAKGRYDLGPLEHRARLNRAREYVELSDDLRRLSAGVSALKKLREGLAAHLGGTSVG